MQGKHASSKADSTVAREASVDNLSEIQLGQLAESQGSSSAIKAFGQRMGHDHTAANDKLSDIAKDPLLTVRQPPSAVEQSEYGKLKGLHRDAFDPACAKTAVHDHHGAIKLFTKNRTAPMPPCVITHKRCPR